MASKTKNSETNDMTMKVVVIVALVVAFIGGYLVARAKYKPQIVELFKMVKDKDSALVQMKSLNNKIMMNEDKMWIVEEGKSREMDAEVTLTNGDKVMTDGTVTKKDGTSSMMQNGDSIDMNGNMTHAGSEESEEEVSY